MEESQVEFTTWFQRWLADYREGYQRALLNRSPDTDVSLALAGGERRGGKTFDLQVCTIAGAVDVPDSIAWFAVQGFREREELHELFTRYVPDHWYRERRAPEYRYDMVHGSTVRVQSSTDTETLKQGRADFVFLNEGQKMSAAALVNSLGGTIDRGGIALIAANPPKSVRGEWVLDLKEAIDENRVLGCRFFGFSAELNTQINQSARGRFKSIVTAIDPRSAEADAEGIWSAIGDTAYPRYRRREHIKPLPQLGDITESVLYKRSGFHRRDFANGVDFQATPFHAGVSLKAFGGREDGRPIYVVVGEMIREGSEDEFLDTVDEADIWIPENTLWVGDASGTWQDGQHRVKGRVSFDVFKQRRWLILPPQKKKTDKGEHPSNPKREDRLNLVNNLLAQGRLLLMGVRGSDGLIEPHCKELDLALRKCQLKNGRPVGRWAHITDALGYILWYLEPKPKARASGGPGIVTIPVNRKGSEFQ